jgi:hypothetical protein
VLIPSTPNIVSPIAANESFNRSYIDGKKCLHLWYRPCYQVFTSSTPDTEDRQLTNESHDSPHTNESCVYISLVYLATNRSYHRHRILGILTLPLRDKLWSSITLSSLEMSKKKICKATTMKSYALNGMVSFLIHRICWYEHTVLRLMLRWWKSTSALSMALLPSQYTDPACLNSCSQPHIKDTVNLCLHSQRQGRQSDILNPPIWACDLNLLSEMTWSIARALNGKTTRLIHWFRWYQHNASNRLPGWDKPLFAFSVALPLIQYTGFPLIWAWCDNLLSGILKVATRALSGITANTVHRNPLTWAHVLISLLETISRFRHSRWHIYWYSTLHLLIWAYAFTR